MPVFLQTLCASPLEYHIYVNDNPFVSVYSGQLHESAAYCFVASGLGFVPYRYRVNAINVNADVQFYQVCLSFMRQFKTFTLELIHKITPQF